jgi:hypothetical protein
MDMANGVFGDGIVIRDLRDAVVIVVVDAGEVGAVTIFKLDLEAVAFHLAGIDRVEVGEDSVGACVGPLGDQSECNSHREDCVIEME